MAIVSKNPDYSDLDLDFIPHPTTGDVVRKFGEDAIKRSIRNLVLTNFYDRPFRPGIGSNVSQVLFEQPSPIVSNLIKEFVKEVVTNFEPRVSLRRLDVEYDDQNSGYNVRLEYEIINRPQLRTIAIFLERIR